MHSPWAFIPSWKRWLCHIMYWTSIHANFKVEILCELISVIRSLMTSARPVNQHLAFGCVCTSFLTLQETKTQQFQVAAMEMITVAMSPRPRVDGSVSRGVSHALTFLRLTSRHTWTVAWRTISVEIPVALPLGPGATLWIPTIAGKNVMWRSRRAKLCRRRAIRLCIYW